MPAPKRTAEERERQLAEMLRLLRRGWSRTRIGEKLGTHPTHLLLDWKECLRRLGERGCVSAPSGRRRRGSVPRALRRHIYIERYAWIIEEAGEAWERSKLDKEKLSAETVENDSPGKPDAKKSSAGKRTKKNKIIEGRLPDADYLRLIALCTKEQVELENLKRAKSTEAAGSDAQATPVRMVNFGLDPTTGDTGTRGIKR